MLLLSGLGLSIGFMCIAWVVYLITNNPGVVDVFWGLTIFSVSTCYLMLAPNKTLLVLPQLLLFIWAARLSLFLFLTRIKKNKVDKRYQNISNKWQNKRIGFLYNFLFQALLAWLVSFAFYYISQIQVISLYQYIGYVLVGLGIAFESLADAELYYFKPQKQHEVCQKGLWQYSRHPNYFFECVIWLGFSVMGFSGVSTIGAFISILSLFLIMWFITIPITEKTSVERRGKNYIAYQNQVSCFFPWFPKH